MRVVPWEKLYSAQRTLGEQLGSVLEAGGPDPWAVKPRTYIGVAKTRKLVELRSAGVAASIIAERLEISLATVYRLVQSKEDASTARESIKGCDDQERASRAIEDDW